ncbi:hypothetical protein [Streptomyces sp. NPDC053755]|uniref:hypothetical protein n=1 Tax=Streptomyces sp. NPDC053755 TaxID=3155815 RepID=UPI003430D033
MGLPGKRHEAVKAERRGGPAPWAKVLGAVLLLPVVALVALFTVAHYRETARERHAFEATRADAERFADALVAEGRSPSDREVRVLLDRPAGDGPRNGVLVDVRPAEHGTRVFVQFSRVYERPLALFGPAETTATRCFTIDVPETSQARPRVTAYGPEQSCTTVAASTAN